MRVVDVVWICSFVTMTILKLADLVDWSWWVVTSPLWFVPATIIVVLVSLVGCGLWDKYLGWVPAFPKLAIDKPEWAKWKILIALIILCCLYL